MFVITQNGKRINLTNITEFYTERKTENGKQKYILYFDKIPVGTFNKQESINKILVMLDAQIQAKQRAEVIDEGYVSKIIYYKDCVFQIPDEDELA